MIIAGHGVGARPWFDSAVGGNGNNGSNDGPFYLNGNNGCWNTNWNIGAR